MQNIQPSLVGATAMNLAPVPLHQRPLQTIIPLTTTSGFNSGHGQIGAQSTQSLMPVHLLFNPSRLVLAPKVSV
jgi:hypothetical protein